MCGIAGFQVKPNAKGKLPVSKMLNQLLLGIESRGPEATGFLAVTFDQDMQLDKAPMTAKKFVSKRKKLKGEVQTMLAHTRLATQGPVERNENNHPVVFNTTFAVHNGMVWNDYMLEQKYQWHLPAEVDSIVIPALINELGMDRAAEAMEQFDGYTAIAAVDAEHPGRVILARGNNSPLVYIETEQFIAWASSIEALRRMWGTCFGTPPAYEKFSVAPEGTLIDIQDGEMSFERFKPKEFVYSSNYGYGYGGSWSAAHGWDDASEDYRDHNWGNGVRSISRKSTSSTPGIPKLATIKAVEDYQEWAEIDNELHHRVLEHLAHELNLSVDLVCWINKNADRDFIISDKNLAAVQQYTTLRYEDIYDACLKAGSRKGNECLTCSDPIPHSEKHCIQCKRVSAEGGYKVGDILKEALKTTASATDLSEYIKDKQVDRRQAIAELEAAK